MSLSVLVPFIYILIWFVSFILPTKDYAFPLYFYIIISVFIVYLTVSKCEWQTQRYLVPNIIAIDV